MLRSSYLGLTCHFKRFHLLAKKANGPSKTDWSQGIRAAFSSINCAWGDAPANGEFRDGNISPLRVFPILRTTNRHGRFLDRSLVHSYETSKCLSTQDSDSLVAATGLGSPVSCFSLRYSMNRITG